MNNQIYRTNIAKQSNYEENFANTSKLPTTPVIQHMPLVIRSISTSASPMLSDFFTVPTTLTPKSMTRWNSNPNQSLVALITIMMYSKSSYLFYIDGTIRMNLFKKQVGKDVRRMDVSINGTSFKEEKREDGDDDPNLDEVADDFNYHLMTEMTSQRVPISFNTLIKCDAFVCQNAFNFLTDLVGAFIAQSVQVKYTIATKAKKRIVITLTEKEQSIRLYFDTEWFVSSPEYICGTYHFVFCVNLETDSYFMEEFQWDYDPATCQKGQQEQEEQEEEINPLPPEEQETTINSGVSGKTIASGIGVATALASTAGVLLAVGLLGGEKSRKKKRKRKRKITNKKTKTTKKRTRKRREKRKTGY